MSRNLGYFTFRKVQNDDFYDTISIYNLSIKGRRETPYNKLKTSTNFVVTRDNSYDRLIALRGYIRSRLVENNLGRQPRYRANGNRIPKKFNLNKERNFSTLTLVREDSS